MTNLTTTFSTSLLIICCLLLSSKLLNAQCHIDDWTALKALYEATDGNNWTNNDGWEVVKNAEPPLDCNLESLYGVNLSNLSRVDQLELSTNNLSGTMPAELQLLNEVSIIRLNSNQLEGNIPGELANLLELQIFNISYNQLNGSIPEFHLNTRLSFFYLQSNYFTCDDLETLNGGYNKLEYTPQKYKHTGSKSYIVDSLNESVSLNAPFHQSGIFGYNWFKDGEYIDNANDSILILNNVQEEDFGAYYLQVYDSSCMEDVEGFGIVSGVSFISDTITVGRDDTKCHIDDWAALKALYETTDGDNWPYDEGWEVLKSDEPSLDCNLGDLNGVTLDKNGRVLRIYDGGNLFGFLPPELSKLKNLEELNFTNAKLKGVIPPEIGNLSNLRKLLLDDNQLTGTIPPEIGNLNNLHFLKLNNNQLTGSIPPELSNLISLDILSLNDNQLSGSIPDAIFNMSNLERLELQNNELTDSISLEVGNMTRINKLDFSNNQLTGNIPFELGNLRYACTIDFSDNQLDGEIPNEIANIGSLETLNLSNNQLSGTFSREIMDLIFLSYFNVSHNKLSGSIPKLIEIDFSDFLYYDITYNNYRCNEIVDSILHVEEDMGWGSTNYTPQNYNYTAENIFLIDSSNTSIKLSAPFSQTGNFAYQWYKNETILDGAIDSILIIDNVQFEDVGNYSLHIFDSGCKHNGNDGWGALEGLEYISNPITVHRTDLEGCTDQNSCNYNPFAMVDDGTCEYLWCDTLTNPIKIRTTNETILSDTQIKFDLVIDSLGLDYSADNLTFKLDMRGNYRIESIEVVNHVLSKAEVDISKLYNGTISINRINNQRLASNEPIVSITGSIVIDDIPTDESTCSHFLISGGTELVSGHFIDFDNIYIDIPFSDCSPYGDFGAEGENWLPLVLTINSQNCNTGVMGLAEIKIWEEGQSPFTYTLKNEQGETVLEATSSNKIIKVPNLNAGNYELTVFDMYGKKTTMHACIPLVNSLDGNETCQTNCVDYVTIPDGNIRGAHFAKKEIEIKGFVGKDETVEVGICE